MNENIREESHYCTSCGAVNKKSAVLCEECNKKIVIRHRPVVDFLKKRAKTGVAGEVTERLFSLIKNFLFDHLYGAILTISIVATTTVVLTSATPYIENVSEPPHRETSVVTETTPEEYGVFELTERDITRLKHVTTAYDEAIDYSRRTSVPYYNGVDRYASATELWAENNIEGYAYKGTYDMYNNPLPMGQDELDEDVYNTNWEEWEAENFWPIHYRYSPIEGIRTGSDVRSALGHTLLDDGYDVMEVDYYCLTYNGEEMEKWDEFDFGALPPADETPYEKYVYTFLLTRKNSEDKWYIAEEVLTEKTGGQRG